MADIELVIKISEEDYNDILNGETKASALNWSTFNSIRNGTPLPKGHGNLKDVDAILLADINFFSISDYRKMVRKLTDADTIIEANKVESE